MRVEKGPRKARRGAGVKKRMSLGKLVNGMRGGSWGCEAEML